MLPGNHSEALFSPSEQVLTVSAPSTVFATSSQRFLREWLHGLN